MEIKKTSAKNVVLSNAAPAPRKRTPRPRSTTPAETPVLTDGAPVTAQAPTLASAPSRDEIAKLAYLYWESRGEQGGSPEDDWIRAERELRARVTALA